MNTNPAYMIKVPMDERLLAVLHLSAPAGSDTDDECTSDQNNAANSDKVGSLLRSAIAVSASHFPMMTEDAWTALLSSLQPVQNGSNLSLIEQLLCGNYLEFYLDQIIDNYSREDYETFGLSRLARLTPAEMLSCGLVADQFWAPSEGGICDLRAILSQVSGRPQECVFSDEPALEDLWEITDVMLCDKTSGRVHFSYAGTPMASLTFTVQPEIEEISSGDFECNETRPLVLPNLHIRSWLFNFALPKIFEALDAS